MSLKDEQTKEYGNIIDVDLFAQEGAKIYWSYDGNDNIRFVSALLQNKLALAERISRKYAVFLPTYHYLIDNYNNADIEGDFEAVLKNSELIKDVDYSILMASLGAFIYQNAVDRRVLMDLMKCVVNALNEPDAMIVGEAATRMLCVALWFSNYDDYKIRVFEYLIDAL